MELSIIIPTKDRESIFNATLKAAVDATTGMDAEIIVVNDSRTGTPLVPEAYRGVKLLQNSAHGVASARNLGARNATGEVILFLDDDIVISGDSLRHVLSLHREKDRIAVNPDWVYPPERLKAIEQTLFGRFLIKHQMTSFKGWYSDASWKENEIFQSASVASFHLSMRRADFMRTGGYDESFPFAGFEDYDFPHRLKKAGIAFLIDTRIRVYHNEEDRLQLGNWLNNQERRAHTRAVAVHRGYGHLALNYPTTQQVALNLLQLLSPLLLVLMEILPNRRLFDRMAFACMGYLEAVKIYRGYSRGLKE